MRGHDERLAVVARHQFVGLRVVHKPLRAGIKFQGHAELHVVLGDVHAVGVQMTRHAVEGLGQALVVRQGFLDFTRRLLRAEPVGDIPGMDQAGR